MEESDWRGADGVARERWSRLRLKQLVQCRIISRTVCGKGAVVSPEIETLKEQTVASRYQEVARERWSRLRLKQQTRGAGAGKADGGKGAVVSPEIETRIKMRSFGFEIRWQGSGGLA